MQKYLDTGCLDEKDQFISCAATGWAMAALALAVAGGGRWPLFPGEPAA